MAQRITDRNLDEMAHSLNVETNSPTQPYERDASGKLIAQVGNYHIAGAYGGVTLHRMENTSGGISTPLHCGYVTKRELYDLMNAYLRGLRAAKE